MIFITFWLRLVSTNNYVHVSYCQAFLGIHDVYTQSLKWVARVHNGTIKLIWVIHNLQMIHTFSFNISQMRCPYDFS